MPEMDGFALLEIIGLEMDMPVISKETFLFLFIFIFHNGGCPAAWAHIE